MRVAIYIFVALGWAVAAALSFINPDAALPPHAYCALLVIAYLDLSMLANRRPTQ